MFNRFYIDIVLNLKITIENDFDTNFLKMEDPVLNATCKYRNHPNVIIKKEKNKLQEKFSFSLAQYDYILKKIKTLDSAKTSKQTDISTTLLKQSSEYFRRIFLQ